MGSTTLLQYGLHYSTDTKMPQYSCSGPLKCEPQPSSPKSELWRPYIDSVDPAPLRVPIPLRRPLTTPSLSPPHHWLDPTWLHAAYLWMPEKFFASPEDAILGFTSSKTSIQNVPMSSPPMTTSKSLKCGQCEKAYGSAPALHMHVRTHGKGCHCPVCGKSFSRHWLLQGHLRTHTGEKPFQCPVCSKTFADKSNMRAHVQTHSGLKPWSCTRCGKSFALKSYLSKHQESACARPASLLHSTGLAHPHMFPTFAQPPPLNLPSL